uniref:Uncharacterized protein n=1 Tax=Xenopus tropicalis TaxID=8364 RepID=A0A1B8XUI4_XENTR
MLSLIFQMSMLYSSPLSCSLFFPEHHTISHYFSCSLFLIRFLLLSLKLQDRDTDKPEANGEGEALVKPEETGKSQFLYLQTSLAPPEYLL